MTSNGTQTADVGLCHQTPGGRGVPAGAVVNFVGANFGAHLFSSTRETYAVSATKQGLAAGTGTVWMCLRNNGNDPINNNNFVNGWVMVTDGP